MRVGDKMSKLIRMIRRIIQEPGNSFFYAKKLGGTRILTDKMFTKWEYYATFGKKLNLKNPQTFNEKIQWLKLNDRNKDYVKMVDKISAKDYVASIIGDEYIIPTIGIWENVDDIDWNLLPKKFVIKPSHDSGNVIICKNKEEMDFDQIKEKIKHALYYNYYEEHREWIYKYIEPRVIVEEYMEDSINYESNGKPNEYQFWCFNGKPLFVSLIFQPHGTNSKATYDMGWRRQRFVTSKPEYLGELECPPFFDEMLNMAKTLSVGHVFLRVDFMVFDSKIYFSELTKTPASGLVKWDPAEFDSIIGKYLDVSMMN